MKNSILHTIVFLILLQLFPMFSSAQESIRINDMPEAFFQNWQSVSGIWWYDIRREFFGSDNRLWTYESIIRNGDSYTILVRDAFGDTKEIRFQNIRPNSMTAYEGKSNRLIELGPKPFDISFLELAPSDLPEQFRGTWSSSYGCGESVDINDRQVRVNGGDWELHQIIREAGRYRIYLRNGNDYWLWLPHVPNGNYLAGIFNRQIRLMRQ